MADMLTMSQGHRGGGCRAGTSLLPYDQLDLQTTMATLLIKVHDRNLDVVLSMNTRLRKTYSTFLAFL